MELQLKSRQIKIEKDREECQAAVHCVPVDVLYSMVFFTKHNEYSSHFPARLQEAEASGVGGRRCDTQACVCACG